MHAVRYLDGEEDARQLAQADLVLSADVTNCYSVLSCSLSVSHRGHVVHPGVVRGAVGEG